MSAVRRVVVVIIVVILAVTLLASIDNALTPALQLTPQSAGPVALAAVSDVQMYARTSELYAATNAGVFKSTDAGATWLPASHGLPGVDIHQLYIDQQSGDIYAVVVGIGLFRTTDGALNWVNVTRQLKGAKVMAVNSDPRTGLLYVGLEGYGMYTSSDTGATWQTVGFGLSNTQIRAFLVGKQPGEVYAATDSGIYRTTQITGTWDLLTAQLGQVNAWSLALDAATGDIYAGADRGVIKITPHSGGFTVGITGLSQGSVRSLALDVQKNILYAGTLSGIFRSVDAGDTWALVNTNLSSTLVRKVLVAPGNGGSRLVAGTDSGIYLSDDGAATWQPAALNPSASTVQALMVAPHDQTLYAGTLGGGVFRSTDQGAHWQAVNTGLGNTVVQALGIEYGSNSLYAGTRQGLYRSPIDAISWSLASPSLANANIQTIAVDERHGNVYAVTIMGDVIRSGNGGASWSIVQRLQRIFARTVAVSSFASAVYVGAYKGGVMVSHDFGFSWQPDGGDLPDRNVEKLAVDESDGTLFAGTLTGNVFRIDHDGGNWAQVGGTFTDTIVALTVDKHSGAVLAGLQSGLYRFARGDTAWNPAMSGMAHTSILALTTDPNSSAVFAGTLGGGAARSTDAGLSWNAIASGLSDSEIRGTVSTDEGGALVVSVTDRGTARSEDGGKTWRPTNAGLSDLSVKGLALSPADASLALTTETAQYQLPQGSDIWQPWVFGLRNLASVASLVVPIDSYGYAGRMPDGGMVWASRGGGNLWTAVTPGLGIANATIGQLPGNQSQLYVGWGAELLRSAPGTGYGRIPLAWLTVRVLVWNGFMQLAWLFPWWWETVLGVGLLGLLLVAGLRLRISRLYGVPLRVAMLRPASSAEHARAAALDAAWPKWERAIRSVLYAWGDVRPVDLPFIAAPFRLYAMQRFVDAYGSSQSLEMRADTLYAAAKAQINYWVDGWQAVTTSMLREGVNWTNRRHVDQMAHAFAHTLHLQADRALDVDAVRAYALHPVPDDAVAAPETRLALLFVADNEALARTVRNLLAALDAVKLDGAQGIVISLGRPGRDVDVTSQIRIAVADAGYAARLKVLTGHDILDIMSATDPVRALADRGVKVTHA